MTEIVGGLRARLVDDSLYYALKTALTTLGWFSGGRQHLPIDFVNEARDPVGLPEIALNTLALSGENISDQPGELGSQFSEFTRYYYIDFFAESDALGKHLIGDVKDLLQGRMASAGRSNPIVPVFDWRQATPSLIFQVEVDNVKIDRAHGFPHPWTRHWFSCQFTLTDWYGSEDDANGLLGGYAGGY